MEEGISESVRDNVMIKRHINYLKIKPWNYYGYP